MNMKELNALRSRIDRAIQARRISEALNLLQTMASMTASPWSVTDEIGRMRQSYEYMCRYALDGINDPDRDTLYENMVASIGALADRMVRDVMARDASSLYFDTVRYNSIHPEVTVRSLIEELTRQTNGLALRSFSGNGAELPLVQAREEVEKRLFKMVWTEYPLTHDAFEALKDFFHAETTPRHERLLLISAVLLGLLNYYDSRRMMLLMDFYAGSAANRESETAMRALVALVLALWTYRDTKLGRDVDNRLASLMELPSWHADVKMVTLLLLRTRDTEKIARQMTEEVIPSMMKLRPDIYGKLRDKGELDMDSLTDENPEWEELLEKSGLTDKLKKLTEMQEQGGDVMMATFSHLKTFPFFSEITNWFMPYHDEHSSVITLHGMKGGAATADMVAAAEFVCSSDRFSMLFSISSIPEQQRGMMLRQFEAQNINMAELRSAELTQDSHRRETLATNYIRDLYRFFKLFRRKGEFADPFAASFNPFSVPALVKSLSDLDSVALVGEFFFHHGYWEDALVVFGRMLELTDAPAQTYQKMGFAAQKLGRYTEAISYYKKAEMLDPSNRWTWRKLAACYRLAGEPQHALPYYERLEATQADDLNLTMQKANALAETGDYASALKLYFKVEFLDSKSRRALRPIAWTAFLSGDYETSRRYFDRVLADDPTASDLINLGHLEMATGHYRDAVEIYSRAIEMPDGSKAAFARSMQEDLKYLRRAGVEDLITGIVLDRLLS